MLENQQLDNWANSFVQDPHLQSLQGHSKQAIFTSLPLFPSSRRTVKLLSSFRARAPPPVVACTCGHWPSARPASPWALPSEHEPDDISQMFPALTAHTWAESHQIDNNGHTDQGEGLDPQATHHWIQGPKTSPGALCSVPLRCPSVVSRCGVPLQYPATIFSRLTLG